MQECAIVDLFCRYDSCPFLRKRGLGWGAIKIDVSKVGAEDKVEAKQFGYKYVVMRPAAPGCRTHVTIVFA